jgi:hypothetical protein
MFTYSRKKPVVTKNKAISLRLQKKDVFRSKPLADVTNRSFTPHDDSLMSPLKHVVGEKSQKERKRMYQNYKGNETRHRQKRSRIQVHQDSLSDNENRLQEPAIGATSSYKARHRSSGEEIQVYNEDLHRTGEPDPEWIISPRKLFTSSSQSSDDLVLAKAEFCSM